MKDNKEPDIVVVTKSGNIGRVHFGNGTKEQREERIANACIRLGEQVRKAHPDVYARIVLKQ